MNIRNIWIIGWSSVKAIVRKKDFYVFLILLVLLLLYFTTRSIFGIEGICRYVKDVGYSSIILFSVIIAITFSAKQIPEELQGKTIYPLLSKPVSRKEFVLGKYCGGLLVNLICFTSFYALYLFSVFYKGEGIRLALVLQAYLFILLMLALLSAVTIFFSTIFTISANVTLSFIIYFFAMWFGNILRTLFLHSKGILATISGFIYYFMPHYEFYDLRIRVVHSWEPLPLWVVFAVVIYTVVYTTIILILTSFRFNRKTL